VSSPRRIGLPQARRMRHDLHFVDQLSRPGGAPIGKMIPIEEIETNPDQPRRDLGDLSELAASIREKGIIEPILVRPAAEGRYQIIAGERRYRAAIEAGLGEVPCVVRETEGADAMEIALIENLQRKDLDPFEEADGLRALVDSFGYTHEQVAERIGKSRTSITESLSIATMPTQVRDLCRLADIASKSLILQIVRQPNEKEMLALIERLQETGATRAVARKIARDSRPKGSSRRAGPFVFHYKPPDKTLDLKLKFRRSSVTTDEIIGALQKIIEDLLSKREDASGESDDQRED
jgi:ParB family transcriptional regulator, chromosome partitioning protein